MKKLAIALMVVYALLVAVTSQAENITVSGIITNTGGAPVEVHFTDGDTIVNMSVFTGPMGQYSVVVTTDDSSGVLIVYFFDCDSGLVDTIIPYYTGMPPVIFNADYCDSLGTSICLSQVNIILDSLSNVYTLTIDSTVQQNAIAYLWDFGNGDSSIEQLPAYSYPQAGTYDVCLTVTEIDGQVCMSCNTLVIDTAGLTLDIIPFEFTGTATIDKNNFINVYPNPTSDVLKLTFTSTNSTQATLRVVNAAGAVMKTIRVNIVNGKNALVVNMHDLPNGFYNIMLVDERQLLSSRVIKQ